MNPFFVFYCTPSGMHAYKEYCRVTQGAATVSLDATGSLVKKINHFDGARSGHIFLYSIVINFEKTTLPVYQMLSEAHGTDLICFWLKHWDRAGAPRPKITVCDYSRALLASLCEVYNKTSVKEYAEWLFAIAANDGPLVRSGIPGTIIRVDVAHVTKMFCRWKCFKSVRQRCITEFYLRCVALMVESMSLEEFQQNFVFTCAVGLQNYEDSVINLYGVHSTREARERLEDRIAGQKNGFDSNTIDKMCENDDCPAEIKDNYGPLEAAIDSDSENVKPNSLFAWLTQHKKKAEQTVSVGKYLNPFYLPDFIRQLFNLAKEFPLWTSAAMPFSMPRPIPRASSSYVEGYFSDLKTRVLKNTPPPLRVDKFIKLHIRDISGQTLLFSSNVMAFEQKSRAQIKMKTKIDEKEKENLKKATLQTPQCLNADISNRSEVDLKSQEDWKGKASHGKKYIFNLTNDSLPDYCEPITSSSRYEENSPIMNENSNPRVSVLSNISIEHDYCKSAENHCNNLAEENNVSEEPVQKRKKVAKYYDPCPDIRQRNILAVSTSKAVLLPNGSLCDKPTTVDGNKVFVKSTCPFDSLVHILMTGALDNPQYASILQQSSNETLQFVWSLINGGVTKEVLQQRAILLKHLGYPCLPGPSTENRIFSYSLNAWDSIANVAVKALNSSPSVWVTEKYTRCDGSSYPQPYLSPNHKKIEVDGFHFLEEALNFQPVLHEIRCRRCGAPSTAQKRLNIHIFIDLDIRACTERGVAKAGLRCKLEHLPSSITFKVNEDLRLSYR